MKWNPAPTVTIGGVNYTGSTLDGVTITMGRPDTTQQPQAGYANLRILDLASQPAPFALGAAVTITALDSTATSVPLFTGTISDIITTVESPSINGHITTHTVIATGSIARLNRRTAGAAGYPSQGDGDRVARILEILAQTWDEPSASLTWNGVAATSTWATYDPLYGQVDQPGLFTLAAYTDGEANAYELSGIAALSGLGVVYETGDGKINYADANSRQDDASINGYLDIPVGAILGSGLETSTRLGDATNQITVVYSGGEVTVTDTASIAAIGPAAMTYTTALADVLDATEQADRYLALNAQPKPSIEKIIIPVTGVDISSTLIDALARIGMGKPISMSNLPASVGPDFTGFVEGWRWVLTDNTALLELSISDFGRSVITTKWADAPALIQYTTVNATLKWQDAMVIS